jgi:hypothetical protein
VIHREEVLRRIVADSHEEGRHHAPSALIGTGESQAAAPVLSQPT